MRSDFKRSGNQWLGCCVSHNDKKPSMIIYEGRNGSVQVRCLSGICTSIEIIEVLRERGVWQSASDLEDWNLRDEVEIRRAYNTPRTDPNRHQVLAMRIRSEALDPRGTIAEIYLRGRGLVLPASCALSLVRYHPRCPKGGDFAPALIVLMRSIETFEPVAIQRLYLAEDFETGVVRKTDAMMLGPAGGAAMMLSSREETFGEELAWCPRLHVAEGFETALALYLAGCRPIWALGSAGGIARFPVIFGVGELVICADHDKNGVGQRAAAECTKRWNATTHQRARIVMPSQEGADFADVYRSGADHG